jgi:hypothetical protein
MYAIPLNDDDAYWPLVYHQAVQWCSETVGEYGSGWEIRTEHGFDAINRQIFLFENERHASEFSLRFG